MASIYDLKPKFQALLRPLCGSLARVGVNANMVTLAAFALSLAYGALIGFSSGAPWVLLLFPVVQFVRMGMNAIDGMLARDFAQRSDLGALLNEVTDVLSDIALYLPFAVIAGVPAIWLGLVVALGVAVELTGIAAVTIAAPRGYGGPFGKSDRAVFFGVAAVLIALWPTVVSFAAPALWLCALLALITIVNRIRSALRDRGRA